MATKQIVQDTPQARLKFVLEEVYSGNGAGMATEMKVTAIGLDQLLSGSKPLLPAQVRALQAHRQINPLWLQHGKGSMTLDLASALRDISNQLSTILASGLNLRAVVALLKDGTGMSKRDIHAVLDGLQNLEKNYTTKK